MSKQMNRHRPNRSPSLLAHVSTLEWRMGKEIAQAKRALEELDATELGQSALFATALERFSDAFRAMATAMAVHARSRGNETAASLTGIACGLTSAQKGGER